MKKISFILATCLMLCAFSSCKQKVQYSSVAVDWPAYDNVQDLMEKADLVLSGTVTGISFQVADKYTGLPPAEGAIKQYEEEYGEDVKPEDVFELITLYDIGVATVYKGEAVKSTQIRMMGGLENYHVDEQLAAMRKYDLEYIPIVEDIPELKIGETYLLVLGIIGECAPSPINLEQTIYNLHNPFEKNPYIDRGYPDLTAKDIISYFGADKWDTFWTQWQQDNPDWETWIDPETMETTPTET